MPENSKFTNKSDKTTPKIQEETLSEILKESVDRVVKDFRAMTAVLGHKAFDKRYGEGAYEEYRQKRKIETKAIFAYHDEVDRRLWNRLVESQQPNKTELDKVRKAAPLMMMLGGPVAAAGTMFAMGSSPETTPHGRPLPPGFKYTLQVERLRKSIAAEVNMDEKLGRISFESGKLEVIKPEELDATNRIQPGAPKASSPSAPRAAPSTPKNGR
jgi:hypothetical protein